MTQTTGSPEKKALIEAFDHVLKAQAQDREAERAAAAALRRAAGRPRAITMVTATLVVVLSAYLAIARPDWVFQPVGIAEPSAVKEAALRIAVANAVQHVERYRARTGSLPASLAEAGAHAVGITYQPVGKEAYRLGGTNGPVTLTFRSGESLPDFVGNSFTVIAKRSRQ